MCAQTGPTALLILILTQRDRQDIALGFSPSEEAGKLDALLPLPDPSKLLTGLAGYF